jgi:hypothetical protein
LSLEALEARKLLSGYRSIDGTGNNLANPEWGAAGTDLLRLAPAAYDNGISSPAGADRLSPRAISNGIVAQGSDVAAGGSTAGTLVPAAVLIDSSHDYTGSAFGAGLTAPGGVAVNSAGSMQTGITDTSTGNLASLGDTPVALKATDTGGNLSAGALAHRSNDHQGLGSLDSAEDFWML